MRNSSMKQALAAGFGIVLGVSAMAAPIQAHAAKLPGTCDLVKNTACAGPVSLLDRFLALLSFS